MRWIRELFALSSKAGTSEIELPISVYLVAKPKRRRLSPQERQDRHLQLAAEMRTRFQLALERRGTELSGWDVLNTSGAALATKPPALSAQRWKVSPLTC